MSNLEIRLDLPVSLVEGDGLDKYQQFLLTACPLWSRSLSYYPTCRDRRPIDLSSPDGLRRQMLAAAHRHPYKLSYVDPMTSGDGCSEDERVSASSEIKGHDRSFWSMFMAGTTLISQGGSEFYWSNYIVLGVVKRKVEGLPRAEWVLRWFPELCSRMQPAFGYASHNEEVRRRNRDDEDLNQVGVDPCRHIRGLFWLTYFGKVYVDFLGKERLLSAPALEIRQIGEGVLLRLYDRPEDWENPDSEERRRDLIDHLGSEYFFDKSDPYRPTKAPPFLVCSRSLYPSDGPDQELAERLQREAIERLEAPTRELLRPTEQPTARLWVVAPAEEENRDSLTCKLISGPEPPAEWG